MPFFYVCRKQEDGPITKGQASPGNKISIRKQPVSSSFHSLLLPEINHLTSSIVDEATLKTTSGTYSAFPKASPRYVPQLLFRSSNPFASRYLRPPPTFLLPSAESYYQDLQINNTSDEFASSAVAFRAINGLLFSGLPDHGLLFAFIAFKSPWRILNKNPQLSHMRAKVLLLQSPLIRFPASKAQVKPRLKISASVIMSRFTGEIEQLERRLSYGRSNQALICPSCSGLTATTASNLLAATSTPYPNSKTSPSTSPSTVEHLCLVCLVRYPLSTLCSALKPLKRLDLLFRRMLRVPLSLPVFVRSILRLITRESI